jgi:DNA-binding protein H-NS
MQVKKSSLTTLTNEALCKLRDEIAALLESRAEELRKELIRLTGGDAFANGLVANGTVANAGGNGSKSKRKKIAPKYRGPDGETWTGRGLKPRWLADAINQGKQLTDFLIARPDQESRH